MSNTNTMQGAAAAVVLPQAVKMQEQADRLAAILKEAGLDDAAQAASNLSAACEPLFDALESVEGLDEATTAMNEMLKEMGA